MPYQRSAVPRLAASTAVTCESSQLTADDKNNRLDT
jgi:hypothetical protein